MFLEWRLPTGSAGMAAGMTKMAINKRLRALSEQHGFNYATVTQGYKHYAELWPESAYTILALQWTSTIPYQAYRVREGTMPYAEQK